MKKSSKHILLERMSYLNNDFIFPLNESDDRKFYKQQLFESHRGSTYNSLAEHFLSHNKLNGNLNEDSKFLKEFALLLEDDNFDPFSHLDDKNKIDVKEDCLLTFTEGNGKIKSTIFGLPVAYTCIFANDCKSFVKRDGSKFSNDMSVRDDGETRCYGATGEMRSPAYRNMKWRNFDLINEFKGDIDGMINLIDQSIKNHENKNGKITNLRMKEAGDFFSQEYFDAWLGVAEKNPDILFYTFTTSIPFWVARLNVIPDNFLLTASRDEKEPELTKLIDKYDLRQRIMVNTPEEAAKLKLPIDTDDTLAMDRSVKNFALLLHGTQPKKSGLTVQARKNSALLKNMNQGK